MNVHLTLQGQTEDSEELNVEKQVKSGGAITVTTEKTPTAHSRRCRWKQGAHTLRG